MKRLMAACACCVAAVAGFFLHDLFLNAYRMHRLPKNFSVVKPGVLYRSGQMRPEHFQQVVQQHSIRTVVCLNPNDEPREEEIARQLGVQFVKFQMPGSGLGEPELFHEYLRILGDPANRPLLVHCAAGAYRTGVSVALYRMHYEGWLLEDAMREMHYSGCKIYGDEELLDHLKRTFDSIPDSMKAQVAPGSALVDRRAF
jgi:protein tyrosine/serine phosphatase